MFQAETKLAELPKERTELKIQRQYSDIGVLPGKQVHQAQTTKVLQ